jgi:hypothetical protein
MSLWRTLAAGAAATAGVPSTVLDPPPVVEAAAVTGPGGLELASPWAPPTPQLSSILWADVFGALGKDTPVTRETAMAVPAMARARHVLCGFIAKQLLSQWTGETRKTDQAKWISRTGSALTPYHRMLWTVDDLLFSGWSLWRVERDTAEGPITGGAQRVAAHRWSFNRDTGVVLVDNEPLPAAQALLIPGPHLGVLQEGRTAILQASELEATATKVAQNPAAYLVIKYTGEVPQTPEQIREVRTIWAEARRGEFGGVGYLGKDMAVQEMGSAAEHLLVEGRNAAAVNMARLASMPAALVDATNATASLTYETTSGRNAEFLDYGADLYMGAITARLSMDDVVPQRDSIRFDTTETRTTTPSPTGPVTED